MKTSARRREAETPAKVAKRFLLLKDASSISNKTKVDLGVSSTEHGAKYGRHAPVAIHTHLALIRDERVAASTFKAETSAKVAKRFLRRKVAFPR